MTITISDTITGTNAQAEYEKLRYALIAQLEGKIPTPYFDTATPPIITIGVGFNIDGSTPAERSSRTSILTSMGLNDAQIRAINDIWGSPTLADIRNDPHATKVQQDAQNQRLADHFTQILRGATTISLTQQQMQDMLGGVAADQVVSGITFQNSTTALNATQQAAVAALWGTPALSTVQGMPTTTQAETNARNQALVDLVNQTVRGVTDFSMTDVQMKSVFDGIIGTYDTAAQNLTGVTAFSAERAVLASLHYNSDPADPLLGPSLRRAVNQYTDPAEARAEIWYQIRYWSGDQYKRRIIESQAFGLYADPNNITPDEAKAVYRIFALHKGESNAVHAMNPAWDTARTSGTDYFQYARDDVAAINQTLSGLGAAIRVPTIEGLEQSLDHAKVALIDDLNANNSTLNLNAGDYLSTDVLIDSGRVNNREITVDPNHAATLTGSDRADIMLGEGGADTLNGGAGNDVLIGGKDADILKGGAGSDTYVYNPGDGLDTIIDSDAAVNKIIIGGNGLGSGELTGAGVTLSSRDVNRQLYRWDSIGGIQTFEFDGLKKTVTISGAALGGAMDTITITGIDNVTALKDRFGIDLPLPLEVSLDVAATGNSYNNAAFTAAPASGGVTEGQVATIEIEVNKSFKTGDKIKLTAQGSQGSYWDVLTDFLIPNAVAGEYLLEAPEGQNTLTIPIRHNGQVTQNESVVFKAEIISTDANGVQTTTAISNDFNLNIADVAPPASTSVLDGTTGADYLDAYQSGTGTAATINGNAGRDEIFGSGTGDVIDGGADGDWIIGNGGADQISGGAGDDLITNVYGGSTINAGDGNDIVAGNAYEAMTIGTTNTPVTRDAFWADLIQHWNNVGSTQFSLDANGNLNTWFGGGVPLNFNASGASSMGNGWSYEFSISGGTFGAKYFHPTLAPMGMSPASTWGHYMGSIADQQEGITVDGGAGNDLIVGHNQADDLSGGADNDLIQGNGGDDTIDGGAGNDSLAGGDGNDTLLGSDGLDLVYGEAGSDVIFGGAGNDQLWGDMYKSGAPFDGPLDGNDYIDGGAGDDQLVGQGGDDTLIGGADNDLLFGDAGNDTLLGGAGIDELQGGDGNDHLDGGTENDRLLGQAGNDTLLGGAGNDTLGGGDGNDLLAGEEGNDTLYGDAGEDSLYGGSGNDTLYGGVGEDILSGGAGDDTLDGGAGVDTLSGGLGNDTYIFSAGSGEDRITDVAEFNAAGVRSSVNKVVFNFNYAGSGLLLGLGSLKISFANHPGDVLHIEGFDPDDALNTCPIDTFQFADRTFTLQQFLDIGLDLTGTPYDDFLSGTALKDHIHALESNDTVYSAGGDDTIDAGAGDDFVDAGTGNDTVYGMEGNDTIYGMEGNDSIDGGAGIDVMNGGAGTDTYIVDDSADQVIENEVGSTRIGYRWVWTGTAWQQQPYEYMVADIDTVKASVTYTLAETNVENLILTGVNNTNGTGNSLDNNITGNNGDNVLLGMAGNDTLDGGLGADAMDGGLGDDTYYVDNAADIASEDASGGGDDTAYSVVDYTLGSGIENLRLTNYVWTPDGGIYGSDLSGTGNELNNNIYGTYDNNLLFGMGGHDYIDGDMGIDTIYGGDGNDFIDGGYDESGADNGDFLYGEAGNDEIDGQSGDDYISGGTGDDDLYGGDDNAYEVASSNKDTIDGGDGNDYIDGGSDADTLMGGAGDDDIYGGDSNTGWDGIYYDPATGQEMPMSNRDWIDGGSGSDYIDGQAGDDTIYGGDGDDVIYGGDDGDIATIGGGSVLDSNNDFIDGGAGRDEIDGGSGADTLVGGAGEDIVYGGDGSDFIYSSRFGPQEAAVANGPITVVSSEEDATIPTANDVGIGTRFLLEGVLGDSNTATRHPNGAYSGWDFDFYKFQGLKGGDALKVASNQIDFRPESFNLYDSAGNRLRNYNTNTAYSFDIPADGDYYLLVTDGYTRPNDPFTSTTTQYGGPSSSFDDSAGPYSINVEIVGGPNADIPFVFKREFLDAETSQDYLEGGMGNDTYVVDGTYVKVPGTPIIDDCGDAVATEALQWTTDTVVEYAGEGFDTVISSAGFVMGDNIERLELIYDEAGVAAADPQMQADLLAFGMDGTGNAQDNEIIGNILKNHIDGGAGADTMAGGAGDDTYVVDNAGDVVVENAGEGIDTVESSIDYTLEGTNLENLTLTGTAASGRGNAGDNIIHGNGADNVLEGLAGNDKLYGGAGNDTLMGGAGNDRYVFNLGGGMDVIDDALGGDTVFIGNDLTAANIEGERVGNDAVIRLTGTTDSITLKDWFLNGEGVNRIEFCDGSFMDKIGIEGLFNQPPVANADTMTAFEDGGIVITPTTDLLANDTDPNPTDILTVESVGVSAIGAAVSLIGNEVHYDIGNRFQELKAGAVVYDSFEYTINDGNGATATSVVNVTIVGTNDGPVANVDTGAAVEDGNAVTLTAADLMANDTDVDVGDTMSIQSVSATSAAGASVSLVNGDVVYDHAGLFQSLGEGVTTTDTFEYTIVDSAGATITTTVTMTITGTNDAPVVAADFGAAQEDVTLTTTGNVLSNDHDIDQNDVLSVANAGTFVGTYGTLTLNSDGSYTYALDNASMNVQSLAEGQVVTESFDYQATDGLASTPSTLTVSITGTNDAPIVAADVATVQEDVVLSATGNVLANDYDIDQGDVLSVANAGTFVGTYGTLTLNSDGSYTYALDNTSMGVQSLAEGQVVSESFDYVATDGMANTPSSLTVSITGTNDAPIVAADTNAVQEDVVLSATGNVLSNDYDIDQGDVLSVANAGTFVGTYGTLTLNADGSYTYALDNASMTVQSLAEGQVVSETFDYVATDGMANTPSTLTVSITGTNDAPIVAADVAAVQEDVVLSATGNVLSNDYDIDQGDVLSVANAGTFVGTYGTLTLNADGSYTYALDNSSMTVQSLAEGQVVSESFDYVATDGMANTPSTLTVSITGTNDAPIVNVPLADQEAFEEVPFSYQLPADAFIDIDQGDVLSYSATLASGEPLPDWLVFDSASQTFNSDMPDGSAAGVWDVRVTATDQHGASAFQDFTLDVADLIKGTCEEDILTGSGLRDVIYGFGDNDVLSGLGGRDVLIGGTGIDILKGGAGDDILIAEEPMDLSQLGGAPWLAEPQCCDDDDHDDEHDREHGDNHDDKRDRSDKEHRHVSGNLLDGGAGNDTLYGGVGSDMLIGGAGDDLIHSGSGNNVIAFNLGDGNDTVLSDAKAENTISLGGGVNFADLALRQSGNDLILDVGASDSITFRDWYAAGDHQGVEKLQIISESVKHDDDHGHSSKDDSGHSKLRANVQVLDFGEMVEQFDESGVTDAWSLANAKLDRHLEHSNDDVHASESAVGGAMAGQYALTGTLDAITSGSIQDMLENSKFGHKAQQLKLDR